MKTGCRIDGQLLFLFSKGLGFLWLLIAYTYFSEAFAARPQAVITKLTPYIEGAKVPLNGRNSSDPDGDSLTYFWRQIQGIPVVIDNPRADKTSFINPAIIKNSNPTLRQKLTFQLTVDDGKNGRDTDTVEAIVWPVNAYPVPVAGPDHAVTADQAASGVELNGTDSHDDGIIIKYQWKLLSGLPKNSKFRLRKSRSKVASFTFSKAEQTAPISLKFALTVVDNDFVKRTDKVTVTILSSAPLANAGSDQTQVSGTDVKLDASGSSGYIESLLWSQIQGAAVDLRNSNSVESSFIAPEVLDPTQLNFNLLTVNSVGLSEDQVGILVMPRLPVADAGSDQIVISGDSVTLDGDASSVAKSFHWSQTDGPVVSLSGGQAQQAMFMAPEVTQTTQFKFKLIVENASGVSEPAYTTVQVIPREPVANAGSDQAVLSAARVSLSARLSSGVIDSYTWTQIGGSNVSLNGSNSAEAVFTAPVVTVPTVLSFRLVTSNVTGSTADIVKVTINPTPAVANAGSDQSVTVGDNVQLNGEQSTGDIASVNWLQTAGPTVNLSGTDTLIAGFVAPQVSTTTVLTFKLITANGLGSSDDSVSITVKPALPKAQAGPDQTVTSSTVVSLNALQSTGIIDQHVWLQTAGPSVVLSGANTATPSFTAPSVKVATVLSFKLTVSNVSGATEDSVNITVNPIAPTAHAGESRSVPSGSEVHLSGTASTGAIASYHWTQTAGTAVSLSSPNAAETGFTAPSVNVNTVLSFKLTVSNGAGASEALVIITVNPVITPPVANAGPDQTAIAGSSVSLNGTQSSGADIQYVWQQITGPLVSLSGGSSATAGFTAPDVTVSTVLSFRLTASNSAGSSEDTVQVRVNPRPPVANAGSDQLVNAAAQVTLSGSQSAGVIEQYSWVQTAGPAVTLVAADSVSASFTAPAVTVPSVLTFKLTTTNVSGSSQDAVNITVNPVISGSLDLSIGPSANQLSLILSNLQGGAAPYRVSINWGDGQTSGETTYPAGVAPTGTHTYATQGSFSVSVTVTDSNGLNKVFVRNISVIDAGCQ